MDRAGPCASLAMRIQQTWGVEMRCRAVLIILMASLVAACGGTSSPASTPTSGGGGGTGSTSPTAAPPTQAGGTSPQGGAPSACTLLTAADATTALGAAVDQPTVNQGGGNNCTYAPTVITGLTSIELNVLTSNSFAQVKSHVGQGMTLTPVSGLGDDAFYIDAGLAGTTLYAISGATAISVTIFNGNDSAAQIQAAEKVAVQTALARL